MKTYYFRKPQLNVGVCFIFPLPYQGLVMKIRKQQSFPETHLPKETHQPVGTACFLDLFTFRSCIRCVYIKIPRDLKEQSFILANRLIHSFILCVCESKQVCDRWIMTQASWNKQTSNTTDPRHTLLNVCFTYNHSCMLFSCIFLFQQHSRIL